MKVGVTASAIVLTLSPVPLAHGSVDPHDGIRLGMSRPAVDQLLGTPETTSYRRQLLGSQYVEVQYRLEQRQARGRVDGLSERRVLFQIAYEWVPSPPPGKVVSVAVQERLRVARPYRRFACSPS